MIITKSQIREIESLALEHSDALVAFGAKMYRDGIYKGVYVMLGSMIALRFMADYVDKITESWTPENKRALAERGAKILKQISDSVS